ncbi:hypothetical protein LMG32289_06144 [Cupriavidus pampae]|uniref:Uncharacterized protein n=1 Tax=Cupriavidus pampae TaxID=659251 RepID=A0ABM8XZL8_9BURK|nr:hypothetical protein LMG32289_06144 [Cupriavidus pampae]
MRQRRATARGVHAVDLTPTAIDAAHADRPRHTSRCIAPLKAMDQRARQRTARSHAIKIEQLELSSKNCRATKASPRQARLPRAMSMATVYATRYRRTWSVTISFTRQQRPRVAQVAAPSRFWVRTSRSSSSSCRRNYVSSDIAAEARLHCLRSHRAGSRAQPSYRPRHPRTRIAGQHPRLEVPRPSAAVSSARSLGA